MSITDFTNIIENISEHDPSRKDKVVSAISRLQVSQCADPQIIHLRSAATGFLLPYQVPCGKCYHCKETRLNEWVTRMCLETDAHKHCYFVTLTYRSYDKYEDIPEEFLDAFWHYDNNNERKRYCWSPCLIRGEHVSQFMRNLRNDLNNRNIKFFCGSEFGSTYGRPHHHIILWSDEPIYITDVMRAWSHRVQNYSARSGRFQKLRYKCYAEGKGFDYNDLYANGTLFTDAKATLDGQQMTAAHAFRYVSKYLQKGSEDAKPDAPCFSRLRYFYDYLHDLANGCADDLERYPIVMSDNVCRSTWNNLRKYNPNLFNSLPFVDYEVFKALYVLNPSTYAVYDKSFSSYFFTSTLADLCDLFGYRTTMSRGQGIGSVYALENIQRFANGNTQFSSSLTDRYGKLIWPSAFTRKVQDFINPFIFGEVAGNESELATLQRESERYSFIDESYKKVFRLSKGLNSHMVSRYGVFISNTLSFDDVADYVLPDLIVSPSVNARKFLIYKGTKYDIFDKWTHTHYLIARQYDYVLLTDDFGVPCFDLVVYGLRYNKSSRSYDIVSTCPVSEFVSVLLSALNKDTNLAMIKQRNAQSSLRRFEACKSKIKHFGTDFVAEFNKAHEVAEKERALMQTKYREQHITQDNQ